MASLRASNAIRYERTFALSFGAVVLLLFLGAAWLASFLYQRSQATEEDRLCGAVASVVSESLSHVSFAGKKAARELAVRLPADTLELAYISLENVEGEVLAHSNSDRNDVHIEGAELERTRLSLRTQGPVMVDRTYAGTVVKEVVVPYHTEDGSAQAGVVRVGIWVGETRAEQRANILRLFTLGAVLTLAAILVVYLLSRYYGAAAATLANQLRGILDNAPLAIAISDTKWRLLARSSAFDALVGLGDGLEPGGAQHTVGLAGQALPEAARALLQEADASQGEADDQRVDRELRLPGPEGDRFWQYTRFPIATNDQGDVLQHCVFLRDITEAKHSEATIREFAARLGTITATVPVLLYEIVEVPEHSLLNKFSYVSEKVQDLFGIQAQDMVDDPYTFFTLVHPEDREGLMAASDDAARRDGAFQYEFRVVLASGQLKWIRASSLPGEDRGGTSSWSGYMMDITASKLSELALAASEEKYRAIFDNTPVGIFRTTFAGRFIEVNPTLARMIGYESPAELIAAVSDVGVDLYYEPHFKTRLREALLANPSGARVEVEFKRRDGTRFYALINASLQFDDEGRPAFLDGSIEDINERKRAEMLLRQSEDKFSRLFRLSPDSITLTDMHTGVFLDVNDTFIRDTGYAREEALGHTAKELGLYVDEAARQQLVATLEREGHVENFECESRYKDGSLHICSLSSQVVEIAEGRYRLSIIRDITQVKRMQEMMVQTEKMISVGGIAAGIAHEINNPLGIVLQAAQNLIQRTNPQFKKNLEVADAIGLDMAQMSEYFRQRKLDAFIEDIMAASVRASGIIRHMLDFSRKSESRRAVCDLAGIIDKAIELAGSDYDLKKSYDFRKIRIVRDYADDLPTLHCTETEIEQVMLNLLRNAAQALASARPSVEQPQIDIQVRAEDSFAVIQMSDNGPGMTPEVRRRIFEPFYTTKAPGVGTGLGLSVSYFIITKGHGGIMHVDSRPGEGTTFTIELPLDGKGGLAGRGLRG